MVLKLFSFLSHPHTYGSPWLFVINLSVHPSLFLFMVFFLFFIQTKSIARNKHTTRPIISWIHSWMLLSLKQGSKYCLEFFLNWFPMFRNEIWLSDEGRDSDICYRLKENDNWHFEGHFIHVSNEIFTTENWNVQFRIWVSILCHGRPKLDEIQLQKFNYYYYVV